MDARRFGQPGMGVLVQAVGDVAVQRASPATMFDHCRDALRSCDVLFGQLETPVSTRGAPLPHPTLAVRSDPAGLTSVRDAGFSVMSFAGNHCLDWGTEAFLDTIAHAESSGIALCGVGTDITAARRPAIVQTAEGSIAFLGYCSILPAGYWAEGRRAGCVPLRAHTLYEQSEPDQPGTPALVQTYAHVGDMAAMVADIHAAREIADVVIVSMHWGIHFVEKVIADYQREAARAAIDAGAVAIFGHHAHILKGVEMYRGKPVFYSLGNFAIEQPATWDPHLRERSAYRTISALNPTWDMDAAYTLPEETRRTMIARCAVRDGQVVRTSFVPAFIEDGSAPRVLTRDDPRFGLVAGYVEEISEGMGTSFEIMDDEVVVRSSGS